MARTRCYRKRYRVKSKGLSKRKQKSVIKLRRTRRNKRTLRNKKTKRKSGGSTVSKVSEGSKVDPTTKDHRGSIGLPPPELPHFSGLTGKLIGEILGAKSFGSFGSVFKIVGHEDKVIKIIKNPEVFELEKASAEQINSLRDGREYFPQFHFAGKIFEGDHKNKNYIIMEKIQGSTLLSKTGSNADTELTLSMKLKIFKEICQGVDVLHKNELFHGDLKPANIMITEDGSIKIIDFTCSFKHEQSQSLDLFEKCENEYFSVPYVAPFRSKSYKKVDCLKKSDTWSLAVIFYEFLTGTNLYLQDLPKDTPEATKYKYLMNAHRRASDGNCIIEPGKKVFSISDDDGSLLYKSINTGDQTAVKESLINYDGSTEDTKKAINKFIVKLFEPYKNAGDIVSALEKDAELKKLL